jgi:uncharacterized damage-inducible protein DinB
MLQLTPDQAKLVLLYQIGGLKLESRTTAAVMRAVPGDRADYRPDPSAKSAIELVRHIALAENRFIETVTVGLFDTSVAIPEGITAPSEVATWYEERFAKNFDLLTKATPEQLLKPVDFRGMFTWPAIHFLALGLHHTIHHRGQLSTYLRPMGGKVPSIYGESYDSAAARTRSPSPS